MLFNIIFLHISFLSFIKPSFLYIYVYLSTYMYICKILIFYKNLLKNMNFLCERIGFFLKQGSSAHDIKIHYFFVDDDFGLFYCRNYSFLERLFQESDSITELINQLIRKQLKRLKFNNSKISSLTYSHQYPRIHSIFQNFKDFPYIGIHTLSKQKLL